MLKRAWCGVFFLALFLFWGIGAESIAAERARLKRQYTLVNPTPRELRRDLSADRPDLTESPYTVDAGAWQLEMSVVDYAKNGSDETYSGAPLTLKVGVLNNLDFQLVFTPYQKSTPNRAPDQDGVGDTQIRLKYNVWGNDAGKTAFAIMPYIKIPTASRGLGNDEVEGGLILPYSIELTQSLSFGLMAEVDLVYDEAENDYDMELVATAAIGIELAEKWGGYVEGVAIHNTDSAIDFRTTLGVGMTYEFDKNTVFDVGMNLGLTDKADDVNVFAGVTLRY